METLKLRTQKVLQALRRFLFAFCGYYYLWIVLVNTIGYLLFRFVLSNSHPCIPSFTVFGLLETHCDNPYAQMAWGTAVGWPRLFVVPPYVMLCLIWHYGFYLDVGEIRNWLLASIPLLIIAWIGFRYWYAKSPYFSWILTGLLVAMIIESSLNA